MIGKLSARGSWLILAGVVALTGFFGWQAWGIRVDFTIDRLYGTGHAEHDAYHEFRRDFGTDDLLLYVAFRCENPFDDDTRATLESLSTRVRTLGGVKSTVSVVEALRIAGGSEAAVRRSPLFRGFLFGEDGRAVCLWIVMDESVITADRRREVLSGVREILEDFKGHDPHLSGLAAVEAEYVELTLRDLRTFMPIAGVVFILLLAIYFRNLTGTLLPLITVGIGIVWTLGTMRLLGYSMSILSSLIPNLILILGIADTVHFLTRHQEDLRARVDRKEALARTLAVMIPACFLTSVTTSAGFASLLSTGVETIREFGLFAAAGVMIAYVVSITVVPAALDRLPPFRGRGGDAVSVRLWDRVLYGVAKTNQKRKVLIGIVTLLAVGGSVWGMTRLKLESSWLHDLREDNRVHRAHMFFQENLTGVFSLDLRVTGPVNDLEFLRQLDAFQERLRAWEWQGEPGVRHLLSYVDVIREVDVANRALPTTQKAYDARRAMVALMAAGSDLGGRMVDPRGESCRLSLRMNRMTSQSVDAFAHHLEDIKGPLNVTITGKTWLAKRAMDRVVPNMLWSLGLASLVIFGSMALLFRSLAVGLISMIPNLLPMVLTGGFMGWVGIDLNFSTVTVFSIALGIAVDSTIHYLARLRLEIATDPEPVSAMHRAVRGAGSPMIFTTALLLLGFGSILTSNFIFTFHFGLLGAFALLTALAGDLFVAPVLFMVFRPKVGSWKTYNKKL